MKKPFDLVILQPTAFCNINCSYCYLSEADRNKKGVMTDNVLHKICQRIFESEYISLTNTVRFSWHAGEPMVVGVNYYRKSIEIIKQYVPSNYSVKFGIVTNGTLINDEWCKFFKDNLIDITLSVDGPKEVHDLHRKKRNGKGSHDDISRGIDLLNKYSVEFTILTTITSDVLNKATDLYEYYKSIGVKYVGLNFEEVLAFNSKTSLENNRENLFKFLQELYELVKNDGTIVIREISAMESSILYNGLTDGIENTINDLIVPLSVVSFDANGNFCTFSPELLTMKNNYYDGFVIGNVMTDTIEQALQSDKFHRIHEDIKYGTSICKSTCAYFNVCGGGIPGSRLSSNGSSAIEGNFRSSENDNCIITTKMIGDIVLNDFISAAKK